MKNTLFKTIFSASVAFLAILAFSATTAFASDMVILSVTSKTDTTATISARVANVGKDTTIRGNFQYATNSSFVTPSVTSEVTYNISTSMPFSQTITGLTPNTTYYVRALGIGNADGVAAPSSTLNFTTNPTTVNPTAVMLSATAASTTSLNLSMRYDLGSSAFGTTWFELGTSAGSYTAKTSPVSATASAGTHTTTVTGLTASTTYYVRAATQTNTGTYYSTTALTVKTSDPSNNNNNNGNGTIVYVYGCMRVGDANYNPLANQHLEYMCQGSYGNPYGGGTYNNGNPYGNPYYNNNPYNTGNNSSNIPSTGWTIPTTNVPTTNIQNGNNSSSNTYTNPYTSGNYSNPYYANNGNVIPSTNGVIPTTAVNGTTTTTASTTTTKKPSLFGNLFSSNKTTTKTATTKVVATKAKVESTAAEKDYDANQYLASAFWGVGNGFFPTTLIGWLILIFLIFALVVLSRYYFNKNPLFLKPKPVVAPAKPGALQFGPTNPNPEINRIQ